MPPPFQLRGIQASTFPIYGMRTLEITIELPTKTSKKYPYFLTLFTTSVLNRPQHLYKPPLRFSSAPPPKIPKFYISISGSLTNLITGNLMSSRRRRDRVEMMEAEGGVSFPVVFSDGETETDIGDLVVYPRLDFPRFLSVLSHKIGILPGQFTVFLSSPETRQRIPITGKVNFSAISREKNCCFLVELKRSRRRKNHNYHVHHPQDYQEDEHHNTASFGAQNPINKNLHPENVMLLKRGMEIENVNAAGLTMPFAGRVEYENGAREQQYGKERYLTDMGLGRRSGATACEECSRANEMGREVGFHWCAYDPVTFGFRSPAGPISRPAKGSD